MCVKNTKYFLRYSTAHMHLSLLFKGLSQCSTIRHQYLAKDSRKYQIRSYTLCVNHVWMKISQRKIQTHAIFNTKSNSVSRTNKCHYHSRNKGEASVARASSARNWEMQEYFCSVFCTESRTLNAHLLMHRPTVYVDIKIRNITLCYYYYLYLSTHLCFYRSYYKRTDGGNFLFFSWAQIYITG
jgi:hypothetical protein